MSQQDYKYSDQKQTATEPTLTPTVKMNWRGPDSRDEWNSFISQTRGMLHRLLVYDVVSSQTETQIALIEHYMDSEPDTIETAYERVDSEQDLYTKTVDSIPYPKSLYGNAVGQTNITIIGSDTSVMESVINGKINTEEFATLLNIPQCCTDKSCAVHDIHEHETQY